MMNGLLMKRESGILWAYQRDLLFHHLLTLKYVVYIVEYEVLIFFHFSGLIIRVLLMHDMVFSLHVESVSILTLLRRLLRFLVAILSALPAGQVRCISSSFHLLISILKTVTSQRVKLLLVQIVSLYLSELDNRIVIFQNLPPLSVLRQLVCSIFHYNILLSGNLPSMFCRLYQHNY